MKEMEFKHLFFINRGEIAFSETKHTGSIEIETHSNSINISGCRSGLLALASKIIEVANTDIKGYHKHIDSVELPEVSLIPENVELNIGKLED